MSFPLILKMEIEMRKGRKEERHQYVGRRYLMLPDHVDFDADRQFSNEVTLGCLSMLRIFIEFPPSLSLALLG